MANQQDQLKGDGADYSRPPSSSPDQLRRDIAHTRTEMDQTLDALSDRLRPIHLLDDVVNALRPSSWNRREEKTKTAASPGTGATSRSVQPEKKDLAVAGRAAMTLIREHPVSAAMIGAGLAWLFYEEVRGNKNNGSKDKTHGGSSSSFGSAPRAEPSFITARTPDAARPDLGATVGQDDTTQTPGIARRAGQWVDDAEGKFSDAWGATKDSIAGAAGAAGGVVDAISDGARHGWGQVRHFGEKAQEQMNYGYQHSRDNLKQVMGDYPLSMAAAAAALGVISGLLLPGTDSENKFMGATAGRMKQQVKHAGHEALERGKELAFATADAAASAAQQQGLTAGAVIDKIQSVASEIGQCATESASREGLSTGDFGDKLKRVAEQTRDTVTDQAQRAVGDVKNALRE